MGPLEVLVLLIFIGIITFVVWLVVKTLQAGTRKGKKRECPACGSWIARGQTTCPKCGHNFASAAHL